MAETVRLLRKHLLELVRTPWSQLYLVTPRIDAAAVAHLLPHLRREGVSVRVLTWLTAGRAAAGQVDLGALQQLRRLPGCQVRSLRDLSACVYAAGPAGPALVGSAPLTLEALDAPYGYGALLAEAGPALADLEELWNRGSTLSDDDWAALAVDASMRLEARTVSDEIARVGAFVRVSMRGTRRTRRLDPREFGVAEGDWGRVIRPMEVALYKLDDVIRAREELEAVLADHGLEWNGYYLVPRHFLEQDWPRLFAARERQLRERLQSPEGRAALKAQLSQARQELEAFFGELYPRAETNGLSAEVWIDLQVTKVLTETVVASSILEESGLEYRVLTILPEDSRSVEEVQRLLQDPRLRSVQLTFNF